MCVSSPPPSAFPHVHARGLDLSARTGPRPRPRKHPRGAGGEGSPEEMPRSVPRPRRQPRPPAAPLPAPARPPLPLSRGAPERRQPSASAGAALPHPALPSPPKAEKDVFPAQPPQGSRSPNALAELLSCSLGGERCSQGGEEGRGKRHRPFSKPRHPFWGVDRGVLAASAPPAQLEGGEPNSPQGAPWSSARRQGRAPAPARAPLLPWNCPLGWPCICRTCLMGL